MIFKRYDVIIVGAGASGLYAAINLDERLKVLLLSKKEFTLCNSALAQGGIAAALDETFDSVESHINDTLIAGNHENDRENLRILVENGAENIRELVRLGVDFDKDEDGNIALGLEGGHSRNRIAHHKDSTGLEIVSALVRKVKTLPNVDCLEYAHLLRLEKQNRGTERIVNNTFLAEVGVAPNPNDEDYDPHGYYEHYYYTTNICLIATGGIGRVYDYTTNSAIATGDGIQFAYNIGAEVQNMSLIQFHPTAFFDKDELEREAFLISEAARGESAYIYNKDMNRFCDELGPRDVVSQRMLEEEKRTESSDFYLDISHLDSEFIKERFPMIYERLLKKGYDFTKEPVPIYPCQHYLMGGIAVSGTGETTVSGLYATGECAFTGVHGDNRLASNSLLEALVFGRLAAENINKRIIASLATPSEIAVFSDAEDDLKREKFPLPEGLRSEIRGIMQKAFFVVPDYEEAQKGLERVTQIKEMLDGGGFELTPDFVEAKSLATIAYLILSEVVEDES